MAPLALTRNAEWHALHKAAVRIRHAHAAEALVAVEPAQPVLLTHERPLLDVERAVRDDRSRPSGTWMRYQRKRPRGERRPRGNPSAKRAPRRPDAAETLSATGIPALPSAAHAPQSAERYTFYATDLSKRGVVG